MSSCFILPSDFNKESFTIFLNDLFKTSPENKANDSAVFNQKSPSLFIEDSLASDDHSNIDNSEEYFVTFDTRSSRLQKDSKDQINRIKNNWDRLIDEKEKSTNFDSGVEIRVKYERGQKVSPWNRVCDIYASESLNQENKKESDKPDINHESEDANDEKDEEKEEKKDEKKEEKDEEIEDKKRITVSFDDDDLKEPEFFTTSHIQADPLTISMRILNPSRLIDDEDSDDEFEG